MPEPFWSSGDVRAEIVLNYYDEDTSLQDFTGVYMPEADRHFVVPKLRELGALVGDELDTLAATADRNPPILHYRTRHGDDAQRIEKHPAYVELERLAFEEFSMATVSHKPVFGADHVLHPSAKYALTYLFTQSEFGLMCPVSMTDSLTRTVRRYADDELLDHVLPGLLSTRIDELWQGAMFMTERHAGSDVAATATMASPADDHWQLSGEKWFCSNADADVALVLARVQGAGDGMGGIGLFALPRVKPDGTDNSYSIVRLKDKLGSRSMASGEITLGNAWAWMIGNPGEGFTQIAEMMNQSRLSNGVRATGLMRRSLHESINVARTRHAFGDRLIARPLMQRQLLKMLLPCEEALAMSFYTAEMLHRADSGDTAAALARRILTPLIKFRACRDARKVTGDAMEVRGGSGYIEEFIEPRLVRDSHLGSIWEGTSNIVALDVVRAAQRQHAHNGLYDLLSEQLAKCDAPQTERAQQILREAVDELDDLCQQDETDLFAREVATRLYRAVAQAINLVTAMSLEGDRRQWRLALVDLAQMVRFGESGETGPQRAGSERRLAATLLQL